MTIAVNPANVSYLNRKPYITTTEFLRSPIGATVDTTNLVPNGDYKAQDEALKDIITMASAEADNYCFGPLGTLCASENVEQGRYRANRAGYFTIHPAYWPILEVSSFQVGSFPGSLFSIPMSSSTCWIDERSFVITGSGYTATSAGPLDFGAVRRQSGPQQFVQYTYVNGFANAFLTAPATQGATSITVDDATGLYAGTPFTIWDGAQTENVSIASTYDGESLTVPLTNPTTWYHSDGTNASTLPATIKQAVIHLCVANIKARGEGGLVLTETGEPTTVGARNETAEFDISRAEELLHPFIQVWGRY